MRIVTTVALVVILGAAAWAGVAYSDCAPAPPTLIWINPSDSATPSSHTYILCSYSGANTASLKVSASHLGTGDGCTFTASLFNTGSITLAIATVLATSTPPGAPLFSTCFGVTLSAGPPSGKLSGGGSYPYTLTLGVLSTAPNTCENVVGSVTITFTGSAPCTAPAPPPKWPKWGPGVNWQGANLAELDLAGFDLAGDNLQGADMMCDNLVGADLQGANLQNCNLMYADLDGAYLQGANEQTDQLGDTLLTGANFQGANLQNANLIGSVVTGLASQPTDFNGANLQGVNIEGVTATGYITSVGANTAGTLNEASCAATSGLSTYCLLL